MRRTGARKVLKANPGIDATSPRSFLRRGSLLTNLARPLPLRLMRLRSMPAVPPRDVRYAPASETAANSNTGRAPGILGGEQ